MTWLVRRMPDIVDYDAGVVLDGQRSPLEAGLELLDRCLRVASGEAACCADRLGREDFIPWKRGVSL